MMNRRNFFKMLAGAAAAVAVLPKVLEAFEPAPAKPVGFGLSDFTIEGWYSHEVVDGWTHIAVTRQSNVFKWYVDGELKQVTHQAVRNFGPTLLHQAQMYYPEIRGVMLPNNFGMHISEYRITSIARQPQHFLSELGK